MLGKSMPVSILRASIAVLFLIITLTLAAQDHDVPVSVDGIRCDSCGTECSMHCGSRTFRACCYNYIKKRSIPWQGSSADNESLDEGNSRNPSKSSSGAISVPDIKSPVSTSSGSAVKAPLLMAHQTGGGVGSKHIYQRYVPDTLAATESLEEGEILYPLTLRDLMASMVRTMNAYENKKLARAIVF